MGDLALGVVRDVVKTGMAIKAALATVRQNEEECQDLQVLVATTISVLSRLQNMGLTSDPEISGALTGLNGSLDRALKLVTECQRRNGVHRCLTAGDMAKQLRRVYDDIQRKMQLGNLAITASVMESTIELRRTTRLPHTQPPVTHHLGPGWGAEQMEIYSSHSITGDARSEEAGAGIITMVATGTEMPFARSPIKITVRLRRPVLVVIFIRRLVRHTFPQVRPSDQDAPDVQPLLQRHRIDDAPGLCRLPHPRGVFSRQQPGTVRATAAPVHVGFETRLPRHRWQQHRAAAAAREKLQEFSCCCCTQRRSWMFPCVPTEKSCIF